MRPADAVHEDVRRALTIDLKSMAENKYFYRVTGDRQVYIYCDKGLAKVLKGTESADFLNKISALDSESAQKLMKESAAS